jgi:ribose transport system substrate-binding protein
MNATRSLSFGLVFVLGLATALAGLEGCSSRTIDQDILAKDANSDGDRAASQRVVPGVGYSFPVEAGKYTVLGISTDNKDHALAKSNAEGALNANPDIACMVGLWAYNPPAILSALRSRNMVGQVAIVGFDEHKETLAAIADGDIHGTIVQQPYLFGFRSVEYLAAMARGQAIEVPESKQMIVSYETIRADNVQAFRTTVEDILADNGPVPPAIVDSADQTKRPKLMFITNSIDPFWTLAKKGCEKASSVVGADCEVVMPSQASTEAQKLSIEQFMNNNGEGLAISPINAENQVEIINEAAEQMPVICQDSDSPRSNRKFYLGTSNYLAGRAAGKLVKEAIPDGGKVMIFVGRLEVLNAQERSRGVIDELAGKELPAQFRSVE